MAQRLSYICEVCLDENRETIATPAYIKIGEVAAMLDLCPHHRAQILSPLMKLLEESGRPVTGDDVRPTSAPAALVAAEPPRPAPAAPAPAAPVLESVERSETPEQAARRRTRFASPTRSEQAARPERPAVAPGPVRVAVERPLVDQGTAFVEPPPESPVAEPVAEPMPTLKPDPAWLDRPVPVDALPERLRGWPCPGCLGDEDVPPFPSPTTLALHTVSKHKVKMTDVYAAIGKCRFPGCGFDPDEQGDDGGTLAAHVQLDHDVMTLATMVCLLALYDPFRVNDLLMMFWAADADVQGTLV